MPLLFQRSFHSATCTEMLMKCVVLKQMLQRIVSLLSPNAPFLLLINNNSLPVGNMRNTCNSNWELEAYSVSTLCSYIIELHGEGNIVGADALELKLRKFCFFFFKL